MRSEEFVLSRPITEWRDQVVREGRKRVRRRRVLQGAPVVLAALMVASSLAALRAGTAHHERVTTTGRPPGTMRSPQGPTQSSAGDGPGGTPGSEPPNDSGPGSSSRASASSNGALTEALAGPRTTAVAPSGELAFVRFDAGGSHIFVLKADGSGTPRLLWAGNGTEYWPAWSPDGRRLAFMHTPTSPSGQPPHTSEIWTVAADGSGAKQLTNPEVVTTCYDSAQQRAASAWAPCADGQPVWTPDGQNVTFTRSAPSGPTLQGCGTQQICPTIWSIPAAGGTPKQLTTGRSPTWNSKGALAFVDTYSLNTNCPTCDDGTLYQLDSSGNRQSLGVVGDVPWWSPDGSALVYDRGLRVDLSQLHILEHPATTAATDRYLIDGALPTWSPTGDVILYGYPEGFGGTHTSATDEVLFLIRPDGSHQTRLAATASTNGYGRGDISR